MPEDPFNPNEETGDTIGLSTVHKGVKFQSNNFQEVAGKLDQNSSGFLMNLTKNAIILQTCRNKHIECNIGENYHRIFQMASGIDPEVRMAMLSKTRQQAIDEMSVKDILDKKILCDDGTKRKRSLFEREKLLSYVTVLFQLIISPQVET